MSRRLCLFWIVPLCGLLLSPSAGRGIWSSLAPTILWAQTDIRGGVSSSGRITTRDGTPRELGRGDVIDPTKLPPPVSPKPQGDIGGSGVGVPVPPTDATVPLPATLPTFPSTLPPPQPAPPTLPTNPLAGDHLPKPVIDSEAVRAAWEARQAALREGALVFNFRPEDALTSQELAEGWSLLFDAQTLHGWRTRPTSDAPAALGNTENEQKFRVDRGVLLSPSILADPPPFLYTTSQFGDGLLRLAYRSPPGADVRLFLRSSPQPKNHATDCYAIVLQSPEHKVGTFLGRQDGVELTAASDTTQWNVVTVQLNGPRIQIVLNGTNFIDYFDTSRSPLQRGYIGLQVVQGTAEFRQMAWQPKRLPKLELLPRDANLWKATDPQRVFMMEEPSGKSLRCIGPCALESHETFDNFVLQFDYQIPYAQTGAAVVVRADTDPTRGYRCSLHNNPTPAGRKEQLGIDAGGIVGCKTPRFIAPQDEVWNTMTISVVDRHIETWLNGVSVCQWSDQRSVDQPDAAFDSSGIVRFDIPNGSHLLVRRVYVAPIPPRR